MGPPNATRRPGGGVSAAIDLDELITAENSTATSNGQGALRRILEAAARDASLPLSDLTVLDKKVDPYRQDTPAGHRDGAWLAQQMDVLGITKPIHLRGLHYALVSSTSLTKPNGTRYLNTADDWLWLQAEASKAARWLRYVPFDRIVDERNSPPIIVVNGNGAPRSISGSARRSR